MENSENAVWLNIHIENGGENNDPEKPTS